MAQAVGIAVDEFLHDVVVGHFHDIGQAFQPVDIHLFVVGGVHVLVVAVFADVVAGTFNGFAVKAGVTSTIEANGAVATTSMLFIIEAVCLGMILKYGKLNKWVNTAIALGLLVLGVALGLAFPVYIPRGTWLIIIFLYVLVASVTPV